MTPPAPAPSPHPNKYSSLRLVDHLDKGGVFSPTFTALVRGPLPSNAVDGGTSYAFDYSGLTYAINAQLPSPTPYYLIDVCLLHANETAEITAEQTFFNDNPHLGELILWDTNGTATCVFEVDPAKRENCARTLDSWLPEPLVARIEQIRQWLESPSPQADLPSVVVYVHCDGGCDRTGEMIGAYLLRIPKMTWEQMYATNIPCGRPFGCNNYRAVQWYAYYLNYALGYSIADIGYDGGCYDGHSNAGFGPDAGETYPLGTIHFCRPAPFAG
jgi:hypothetical protein